MRETPAERAAPARQLRGRDSSCSERPDWRTGPESGIMYARVKAVLSERPMIRVEPGISEEGNLMKRGTVAAVIVVAVAAALIWSVWGSSNPVLRTADEIAVEIAEQKADKKAEMAARGQRYEPGAFPNEWASLQRAYPYNRINFEQLKEARAEARVMEIETERGRGGVWVERGPTNIGARVTDLAVHPTSTNVVYAAMASGGVFKSTNGGINWTPIFDEQAVLTIGDLAIDPNNPSTIYVGTGEANSSSFSWFGEGLYKSTDAGVTWSYIGLEETRYIGRVIVDPNDSTASGSRAWARSSGPIRTAASIVRSTPETRGTRSSLSPIRPQRSTSPSIRLIQTPSTSRCGSACEGSPIGAPAARRAASTAPTTAETRGPS